MNNITTKILLRSDHTNSDGTRTVYLRLTINRKVKLFSLRIRVLPSCWNSRTSMITRKDAEFVRKNKILRKYSNKATLIVDEYFLTDKHLTFTSFEQQFFNKSYGIDSFTDFVRNELEKIEGELAKATFKSYKSQFRKLNKFQTKISFQDIDIAFLRSFENEMLIANNKNTTNKTLGFIKAFLNRAINQEVYSGKSPFDKYPISRVSGVRDYLTIYEVEKLENLLLKSKLKPNKATVLEYFLFCCYTGLRYTDIKLLKFKNIHNEFHEKNGVKTPIKILNVEMHKTKKVVRIPIVSKAEKFISYPKIFSNEMPVFKVMSSQPTNRYLKEIAKEAGIKKNVSFHVARHTLATNCLEYGIPIEVVSQILGHADLRTTQIYAKVSDSLKISEMQKMM